MQSADCQDRTSGRNDDAFPCGGTKEQEKGQQKKYPGNGKATQNGAPAIADRSGHIHARHADEMHDGNRKGNQRSDDNGTVARLRARPERQPEPQNGQNRRQSRELEIKADRD
ncbi:hypothetical protein D3C87_1670610 [compost metagenome]